MSAPLPIRNRLLAALPATILGRIEPDLEPIRMAPETVLHEQGGRIDHAYFPATAIVSLRHAMANGETVEVSVVGNEGMVGIALFMGGEAMSNRAVALNAGDGYRLARAVLNREFNRFGGRRSGAFKQLLLRYTQALATQMAQIAVCNRHHGVVQRLCRWLLLCLDRSSRLELDMTQERIAGMLGVRREGVTEAAGKLQAAGLIRYNRGRIAVLDRAGLEQCVCECYGVIRDEYERLLPQSGPEAVGPRGLIRGHRPADRFRAGIR